MKGVYMGSLNVVFCFVCILIYGWTVTFTTHLQLYIYVPAKFKITHIQSNFKVSVQVKKMAVETTFILKREVKHAQLAFGDLTS